ncbi:sugar-transfer associated ATP-grasp domain-containing protein [Colwellia sp. Bg11-28]|uniref:sugar-transfer associated ATP-grasp domain-containing protein n=1 Tax=Colwellia sp. Bg11-28 TaxID=2058305 RepID=UPI000C3398E3|nr:sugar-transfer associated ATP-grasp domain-containing protein [Colwellia sp. Bg11-28]PKH86059.1 hypothetical protein CXF79_22900 [Colwellia sp. Bg11-28]
MDKIKEYWNTANNIAIYKDKNKFFIFIQMITCRLLYKFGPQDYVLYNFNGKPFSKASGYMKKLELEAIQSRINKESVRELVNSKLEFNIKCRKHDLPTPDILAIIANDGYSQYRGEFNFIENINQLIPELKKQGDGRFLFKPIGGSYGAGIVRFSFRDNQILNDDNLEVDLSDLFSTKLSANCYILQRCLLPHSSLNQLMPDGSLGTVRMVTIGHGSELAVFLPCLRIPVGKNVTDNFSHGHPKNLIAAVDLDTGCLSRPYGPDSLGLGLVEKVDVHPSNQFKIEGFQFPFWDEMLALVNKASTDFSELKTVGWDVALTENGPCLIEGNWRYDCDILQISFDKGLKKELSQLLSQYS